MAYRSLEACLLDLEKNGQLVRVTEEVDPHLEMAAIHLRVHEAAGPALLFERVKGSRFRAASNIFGTLDRSKFIFRDTLARVQELVQLRNNPLAAIKHPFRHLRTGWSLLNAVPRRQTLHGTPLGEAIALSDLPQVVHWPKDGGAFITLPQVYTEDIDQPGIAQSNLGMYRVQFSGNAYTPDSEAGLHYQLHRGIGVHQSKTNARNLPLKVSVFVGGPPAHTVAAVMPLPEGVSEMRFAGVLGNRRFRYGYANGFCISTDADFVITGEVHPGENKPEGPFGDHLGYYSLSHPFPLLRIKNVFAKKNAIWPFTVVGRPPQEDTSFGKLIHEISGDALPLEIPGLKELHAVDAAGVHPLLLAIGSERYTPFLKDNRPAELLTIANRILGTGQLSLAKFLFITAADTGKPDTHQIPGFLQYVLSKIDFTRDLHFYTQTTIDTLDYSGIDLNSGSKLVLAAYGPVIRELCQSVPACFANQPLFADARLVMPGIVAVQLPPFINYGEAGREMASIDAAAKEWGSALRGVAMIVIADAAAFVAANLNNFLWTAFTRCNPANDIHGIGSFIQNKHWGCRGPLIFDARSKPHHAPPLVKDPATERNIDRLFAKSGSLYGKG